ncbi:prepilin-type N-terminal cleavage/methylation domain-containing protein [Candidatus Dependentiae bacterium]|nr:prepilin-type N-terminal cleavage/methylation domain-containing protein [Candidatus Dependentiae bacterium]
MENKKNISGFTLIEILIGCIILGIITTIIASSIIFHSKALNNSLVNIAGSNEISEFYINFDIEIKSAISLNKIKFDNLTGNCTVEIMCYNPYKNINSPLIIVKYKKIINPKNYKYSLVKEIYCKSSENSGDEILYSKKKCIKNADDLFFVFFNNSSKLTEYFTNIKFDRIEFNVIINGEQKKINFST